MCTETPKPVKRANSSRKRSWMTACMDVLATPYRRIRLFRTPIQCEKDVTNPTTVEEAKESRFDDGDNNSPAIAIVEDSEHKIVDHNIEKEATMATVTTDIFNDATPTHERESTDETAPEVTQEKITRVLQETKERSQQITNEKKNTEPNHKESTFAAYSLCLPEAVLRIISSYLLGDHFPCIEHRSFQNRLMEYCGILGLKMLARQFSDADDFKVAPDIFEAATEMFEKAIKGWPLHEIKDENNDEESKEDNNENSDENEEHTDDDDDAANASFDSSNRDEKNRNEDRTMNLADAVHTISPFLVNIYRKDCVFMRKAMDVKTWDQDLYERDIFRFLADFRVLRFESFGSAKFDILQALFSRNQNDWLPALPLVARRACFVIQKVFKRFVDLSISLDARTNSCIANDMTTTKQEIPQYDDSVSLVPNWPNCWDRETDWAHHFSVPPEGFYNEEDEEKDNGSWMTPQMASKLYTQAICIAGVCIDYDLANKYYEYTHRLPKLARPFYRKSAKWRMSFIECHLRIAARLSKGLHPEPNCTGEEMALHNIINLAEDVDGYETDEDIIKFKNDDNFDTLRCHVVQDEDVLMLFEDGDNGRGSEWGFGLPTEEDIGIDNYSLSPRLKLLFGKHEWSYHVNVINLHPADWFIPFKMEDYRNHL